MKTIYLTLAIIVGACFPKLAFATPASINSNVSVSVYVPVPFPSKISQVNTNYSMDNFDNNKNYKIVIVQGSPLLAQNLQIAVGYVFTGSNVEFTYHSGDFFNVSYFINSFASPGQLQPLKFQIYKKILGVWDWQTSFFYDLNTNCIYDGTILQETYPRYQGDYEVSHNLTVSSSVLPSIGGVAEFDAGASVTLLPGFITNLSNGGSVLAIIDGCGGAYRLSNPIVSDTESKEETSVNSKNENIRIYPNPTFNHITISIPKLTNGEEVKIEISDINGRLLFTETKSYTDEAKIDLNNFDAGLYFISITGDQLHHNQKIIKE